ncbi:basic proline-rich protein-like [Cervus elaphus]|uniref:basic proline-rich protein-like n=1 Tax=Cervus elaphus TaxID=9860 RepID=UPI001CC293ED|nr:basic proline-rich protein-like [Cervus elaphus]
MVGQGRGVAKEAVAPPWRPSARRRQRAQAGGLHRTGPDPTAHQTNRLGHRGGPRPRHGPGPPGALDTPRARRLLPPTRPFRREKGVREGKRGCEDTVGARRPASGEEGRGRPPACLARRTARPATGAGARAASGLSQASGHAPAQARRQDGRAVSPGGVGVCGCSCCFSGLPACASRTLAHPPTRKAPPRPTPVGADARGPAPGGEPSSLRGRRDFCLLNGQVALAALLPRPPPAAPPPPGTLSSAPAPPARLRPPATPRRPSPPALPARGLLRALHASPPCGLGRATPACLPPGTRATHPCCGPANTGLPCTNPSREGRSAGVGAEALRARPAQPQAPSPRPGPRRHRARSRGKGGRGSRRPGRSQARPGVLPASAGSPRARSRSAQGPLLTTTTTHPVRAERPRAPSARAQEPGSQRLWVLGPERSSGRRRGRPGESRSRAREHPAQAEPGVPAPARNGTLHPAPAGKPARQRGFGSGPGRSLRGTSARGRGDHAAPARAWDSGAGKTASAPGPLGRHRQRRGGRGRRRRRGTGRVGRRPAAPGSLRERRALGSCTCPDPGFEVGRPSSPARMEQTDAHWASGAQGSAPATAGCYLPPAASPTQLPTTPPAPTHGPAAKPLWPQALRAQPPVCPDTSLVVAGFLTRTQAVAHGLRWKAHPTSGSRRPHLFTFPNVCLQAPWLTLATLRESITLPSALLRQ